MERSHWAAFALVVFLAGGLLAANVGNDDTDTVTAAAGDVSGNDPAADADVAAPAAPPPVGEAAAELVDLDGWINVADGAPAPTTAGPGPVRIVQFWTFGCYNCRNTLPHLQSIYATWQPRGLEIIGVHAPEFDHEADPVAIEAATVDLGVTWPVALDTERANFRSWQGARRFWPRTYVIDQQGRIRYDHIGEGGYDELEATVAYLIGDGA